MLASRSKNKESARVIYDLNVFKREHLNSEGNYEHMGPWYIHVYEYDGNTTEEVLDPIELTAEEASVLIDSDPYFQDHEPDLWYGLDGFMLEKWNDISDRLKMVFESLPKHKHS
jgi:hypothetical protein